MRLFFIHVVHRSALKRRPLDLRSRKWYKHPGKCLRDAQCNSHIQMSIHTHFCHIFSFIYPLMYFHIFAQSQTLKYDHLVYYLPSSFFYLSSLNLNSFPFFLSILVLIRIETSCHDGIISIDVWPFQSVERKREIKDYAWKKIFSMFGIHSKIRQKMESIQIKEWETDSIMMERHEKKKDWPSLNPVILFHAYINPF